MHTAAVRRTNNVFMHSPEIPPTSASLPQLLPPTRIHVSLSLASTSPSSAKANLACPVKTTSQAVLLGTSGTSGTSHARVKHTDQKVTTVLASIGQVSNTQWPTRPAPPWSRRDDSADAALCRFPVHQFPSRLFPFSWLDPVSSTNNLPLPLLGTAQEGYVHPGWRS